MRFAWRAHLGLSHVVRRLIDLHTATGQAEEAESWREKLVSSPPKGEFPKRARKTDLREKRAIGNIFLQDIHSQRKPSGSAMLLSTDRSRLSAIRRISVAATIFTTCLAGASVVADSGIWNRIEFGVDGPLDRVSFPSSTCFGVEAPAGRIEWTRQDSGLFLYQEFGDETSIEMRLRSATGGGNPRFGLAIRESLDPSSRSVATVIRKVDATRYSARFGVRGETDTRSYVIGGSKFTDTEREYEPTLRLRRTGSMILALLSEDGEDWREIERHEFDERLPETLFGGIIAAGDEEVTTGRICSLRLPSELERLPIANIEVSADAGVGPFELRVDASSSLPGSSEIVAYHWDFGFGNKASGPTARHTFTWPLDVTRHGRLERRVSLTVIDRDGHSVQRDRYVTLYRNQRAGDWNVADLDDRLNGFVDIADGCLQMSTGGGDIFRGSQFGKFAFRRISGDFHIECRLPRTRYLMGGEGHAGLMFRETVEDGSRFGMTMVFATPVPEVASSWRTQTGGDAEELWDPHNDDRLPYPTEDTSAFLRLERRGNTVSAWASETGSDWQLLSERTFDPPLADTILVGPHANTIGSLVRVPLYDHEFCEIDIQQEDIVTQSFIRGDFDESGRTNLTDAVLSLHYLLNRGAAPSCTDSADANDDGTYNVSDGIFLLTYLFQSGERPSAPFVECGVDRTRDELRCDSFAFCGN